VTLTSMMFMIPMPPTTSEMPAMAPSSKVNVPAIWLKVLRKSCWLWMVKSSWATLWRVRSRSPI
jgi:hypothetical protein